MKKYILFAYMNYYPSGGMGDQHGSFDTVEEAVERFKSQIYRPGMRSLDVFDWDEFQIVDRDTWQIVKAGKQNDFR